jgi:hypothetical protein
LGTDLLESKKLEESERAAREAWMLRRQHIGSDQAETAASLELLNKALRLQASRLNLSNSFGGDKPH